MEYQPLTGEKQFVTTHNVLNFFACALQRYRSLVLALLVQSKRVRSTLSYAIRFLAKSSSVYDVKMVIFLMSSCHILG